MQTRYTFSFSAGNAMTKVATKRFMKTRLIIDAIRQGMGRAVNDVKGDNDEFEYGYLVGMAAESNGKVSRIQSAAGIPKWHAEITGEDELNVTGRLTLLLEGKPKHPQALISQMIVLAGNVSNIKLTAEGVTSSELDFEVADDAITYAIDTFLPGVVSHADAKGDKAELHRRTKALYPLERDPDSQRTLSQSCGKALKRHLIEIAEFHGLNPDPIKNTIFVVRARWVAHPVPAKESAERREAIHLTFKAPLQLSGDWFAGSYRHKGMGMIQLAPTLDNEASKGVFIL